MVTPVLSKQAKLVSWQVIDHIMRLMVTNIEQVSVIQDNQKLVSVIQDNQKRGPHFHALSYQGDS